MGGGNIRREEEGKEGREEEENIGKEEGGNTWTVNNYGERRKY